MLILSIEKGFGDQSKRKAIEFYGLSASYDEADIIFTFLVEPLIYLFTKDDFIEFLNVIEQNSQTYERRTAAGDHNRMLTQMLVKINDLDIGKYINFNKSIQK